METFWVHLPGVSLGPGLRPRSDYSPPLPSAPAAPPPPRPPVSRSFRMSAAAAAAAASPRFNAEGGGRTEPGGTEEGDVEGALVVDADGHLHEHLPPEPCTPRPQPSPTP